MYWYTGVENVDKTLPCIVMCVYAACAALAAVLLPHVTCQMHGTARGGDCDELRLLSDETTYINLRAHGGSFSFLGTKVLVTPKHNITVLV